MNCPACNRVLRPTKSGPITVDACIGGCGGIWFDAFEMQKVDEATESAGEALLQIEPGPAAAVDMELRRRCPRCDSVVMLRHAHRDDPAVMVDECPGCGGFWLDAGELGLIRHSHSLVEQKRAHTQALLEQLKQQSLASWPHKAGAGQQRAASIANIQAWVDAGPQ